MAEAAAAPVEATAYAGLLTRGIAFTIDAALVNVVAVVAAAATALVASVLSPSDELRTVAAAIGGFLYAAWTIGYFVTFWTTTGQTPGNRVMMIRVLRTEGRRLRPRHGLLRFIGLVASMPLLWGFVPVLLTDRRRGFADWLAGTVVVHAPRD